MIVPYASPSARDQNPYGGFVTAGGFNQHKRRTSLIQPIPPITSCNVVCTGIAGTWPVRQCLMKHRRCRTVCYPDIQVVSVSPDITWINA